ncbi:MAG: hypothetical protein WCS67_01625 [Bacteroidales bacterium]
MDIDLLSKIVKGLIIKSDTVLLPGLGCFAADVVPSSFSDKGYTINPPYRRLSFRPVKDGDSLLVDFYAESNGISKEASMRIITDFIAEMKQVLKDKKTIVFPGLGRLRATRENNFFFIADEELDIYPAGFGLKPVSLKTHSETDEEVSAAIADLKSILSGGPKSEDVDMVSSEPEAVMPESVETEAASCEEEALDLGIGQESMTEKEPEKAPEEVAEQVVEEEPAKEPEAEQEKVAEMEPEKAPEGIAEQVSEDVPAKVLGRGWRIALRTLLIVAIVLVSAFLLFFILSRVAPDFTDSILYTPEELRIINY